MSENHDEKLDRLLRSRRIEPASPDLAAQIIRKTETLDQARIIPLWQWVRQSFAEFYLPKPGYVLASALVLGIVVGFTTAGEDFAINETDAQTTQSFLSGDEGLL
ncbi:MAG: hypothetical protein ACREP5_05160 [Candidatus Binatia bacterium]